MSNGRFIAVRRCDVLVPALLHPPFEPRLPVCSKILAGDTTERLGQSGISFPDRCIHRLDDVHVVRKLRLSTRGDLTGFLELKFALICA